MFHALALSILGAIFDLLLHYGFLSLGAFQSLLLTADSTTLLGTGASLFGGGLLLIWLLLSNSIVLGRVTLLKLRLAELHAEFTLL